MFAIELVLPFLIFGARRLRKIAFLGTAFLQIAIMITGNYGFFNLTTLALCVLLLDDQSLAPLLPRSQRCFVGFGKAVAGWQRWAMPPLAAVMLFFSLLMTFPPGFTPAGREPGMLARLHDSILRFRTVNRYGLFANMTITRPELVIQGSEDGVSWHTYEFHWKPGRVDRAPAFMQPHMPRVDWQMWFSALTAERLALAGYSLTNLDEVPDELRDRQRWLFELLERILLGTPEALRLFSHNPFAGAPPRYLHVGLDAYRFADMEDHAETGAWWDRGIYAVRGDQSQSFLFIPPVELIDGRLQLAAR